MDEITTLVVDDDINIVKSIETSLGLAGIGTVSATRGGDVPALLSPRLDVVLLDVYLGPDRGKAVLKDVLDANPLLPVIMISGLASTEEAVDCIKAGAFDFIEKPLDPERLVLSIRNAASYGRMRRKLVGEALPVHRSPQMAAIVGLVQRISATDSTVLITGETGVGKDLIARLIHNSSRRASGEFVKINCGAIPLTLVESELFGHKKGSFTGALADSMGKIQAADGGTCFLDEIAELPMEAQSKLLRLLENREIQRIGETRTVPVDVRIVAATNRDLEDRIRLGSFREDLYYRLNVFPVHIPPLRERKADIAPLADHFRQAVSLSLGIRPPVFTPDAVVYLESLPYRGNVRELRNIVERVLSLTPSAEVGKEDVLRAAVRREDPKAEDVFSRAMPLAEAKLMLEERYIRAQLERHGRSIKATAFALGLLPNNLYRRMKQLGIDPAGYKGTFPGGK
jgi:DNA-binding NtrC family response regulator